MFRMDFLALNFVSWTWKQNRSKEAKDRLEMTPNGK